MMAVKSSIPSWKRTRIYDSVSILLEERRPQVTPGLAVRVVRAHQSDRLVVWYWTQRSKKVLTTSWGSPEEMVVST